MQLKKERGGEREKEKEKEGERERKRKRGREREKEKERERARENLIFCGCKNVHGISGLKIDFEFWDF